MQKHASDKTLIWSLVLTFQNSKTNSKAKAKAKPWLESMLNSGIQIARKLPTLINKEFQTILVKNVQFECTVVN